MRILFICTGNTCRSPMAEAILKNKAIQGVEAKSAGVFAIDGNPASDHARAVLSEYKIPAEHRSTMLSAEEVNWATHIFTMTESHKSSVLNYYPQAVDKTFTLKEFAANESTARDISDPFGGSLEVYRKTYEEIAQTIEKLINRLIEEQS